VLFGAVEPDGEHDLLTCTALNHPAARRGDTGARRAEGGGAASARPGSRAGTWRQRARQRGRRTRGVCWVLVVSSGGEWFGLGCGARRCGVWRNLAEESGRGIWRTASAERHVHVRRAGWCFLDGGVKTNDQERPASATRLVRYLVDPASSHMLVPKINPCTCK